MEINHTLLACTKYHNLGFSILWLKPKSKMPVESKWTSGPKKELINLHKTYNTGYNIGTRLGEVSCIKDELGLNDDSYLAVIDVDVKSSESKHHREINKKLKELFGDKLEYTSKVNSGRGNNSCHYYVRTKIPVKPKRLSQSNDKVKVLMPSVMKFSKYEEGNLTSEELVKGIRLRPAWEISLMGCGQQVVMPPSIHPDSGRRYTWARELNTIDDLILLDLSNLSDSKIDTKKNITVNDITFNKVNLDETILSNNTVDLITTGKGCTGDRSSSLFSAVKDMVRCQMTDSEILSILTDRNNYLGQVAYDHTKSPSKKIAATWLRRFTLYKVRQEYDLRKIFESECVTNLLSDDDSIKQVKDLTEVNDWRLKIERSYTKQDVLGKPKNTLKNIELILKNAIGNNLFKRDEFACVDLYGCNTPWGGRENKEIHDIDILNMKGWFFTKWRFEPTNDKLNEAVARIADKNKFHPVRNYLNSIEAWDGKNRLDTWMKRLLGAKAPEPYLSDVSKKIIVALIARVFNPGTKFDQVTILQGPQGIGKSTAIRHLASDAWFSDSHINIQDKDSVLALRNVWAFEMGELASMRKADIDQMKEFITRKEDKIRLPYGRRTENFPRQTIFFGTTNSDEFLKDDTGNRRFWPVEVTRYDFQSILKERDQLFAEALIVYSCGESLYLDNNLSKNQAINEQEKRYVSTPILEILRDFFEAQKTGEKSVENSFPKSHFSTQKLFDPFGPLTCNKFDMNNMKMASSALKKLGFTQKVLWNKDLKRTQRIWVK